MTMKAVQYRVFGRGPELVELDVPEPGPGQVRLKVTAAGLCHSDWGLMTRPGEHSEYGLPLTLGHEAAGTVDKLGAGVTGLEVDSAHLVYGPWGCGRCRRCSRGEENYCAHAAGLGIRPPGLGVPGALAEYLIVDDARHLVPLGDLDPVGSVSLTDAGLTPYHAIRSANHKLFPGATAVVIGVGGLGHVAIQLLRAMSGATVIAVDVSEEKLDLAREVGAHHTVLSDDDAVGTIRELTGVGNSEAVFDFVGTQSTLEMAGTVVALDGFVHIVGLGGGSLKTGFFHTPLGAAVRAPYWGSRGELHEVLDLARSGDVAVHVERFSLDDAVSAYGKLRDGRVRGRAVIAF